MAEYKEKENFKRILSSINLSDVVQAVYRGKEIRKENEENATNKERHYGKFTYYTDNPDMTIHQCIEYILSECGVM